MGDDQEKKRDEQTPSGYPQHSPGGARPRAPVIHGIMSPLPLMPKTCTTGRRRPRKICPAKAKKIPELASIPDLAPVPITATLMNRFVSPDGPKGRGVRHLGLSIAAQKAPTGAGAISLQEPQSERRT